jgi:hypothetical protein
VSAISVVLPGEQRSQSGHKNSPSRFLGLPVEITDQLRGTGIVGRDDVRVDLLHHARRIAETGRHDLDWDSGRERGSGETRRFYLSILRGTARSSAVQTPPTTWVSAPAGDRALADVFKLPRGNEVERRSPNLAGTSFPMNFDEVQLEPLC